MKTPTFHADKLFFTGDTHFGHGHEALLAHRKFASIEEMDVRMQGVWNLTVPEDATVIHVGDVAFHKRDRAQEILAQLNGRIFLVPGNHDRGARFGERVQVMSPLWEIKVDDREIRGGEIVQDLIRIVLCHFPLQSWNRMHYGAWHLHGHSHGNLPGFGRRQDVGWDVFHQPVSYWQLKGLLGSKQVKSFDHHQPVSE